MLSFEKGRPIAIVQGGRYDKKIINLYDPTQKCCEKCKGIECRYNPCCEECKGGDCGKGTMMDASPIQTPILDNINDDFIKKIKAGKFSINDYKQLMRSFKSEQEPENEWLRDVYKKSKEVSNDRSKKEFLIHDEGIIQPLPRFDKTERAYISGPTDSGKSYFVRKYMEQLRKVYPNRKIYLFSDVEEDEEIDKIPNLIRVHLDEDLIKKKPIRPETLKNSIVLFDDIDSIQNPKLYKVIAALRDSLLRRGRHEDISVICTNHLLTNYKDTRIILNECNTITFFPRSGGTDAIKYTLKKYGGLSSKQIQTVMSLPSRWIMLYKCYPNFILYEKGVYLL